MLDFFVKIQVTLIIVFSYIVLWSLFQEIDTTEVICIY